MKGKQQRWGLMGALLVEMDERWRTEPIPYFNMKLLLGEKGVV